MADVLIKIIVKLSVLLPSGKNGIILLIHIERDQKLSEDYYL